MFFAGTGNSVVVCALRAWFFFFIIIIRTWNTVLCTSHRDLFSVEHGLLLLIVHFAERGIQFASCFKSDEYTYLSFRTRNTIRELL